MANMLFRALAELLTRSAGPLSTKRKKEQEGGPASVPSIRSLGFPT